MAIAMDVEWRVKVNLTILKKQYFIFWRKKEKFIYFGDVPIPGTAMAQPFTSLTGSRKEAKILLKIKIFFFAKDWSRATNNVF